jgi:hypothetical protein
LVIALSASVRAQPQRVPLDQEQGVRGRVVIAPELLSTPVPLSPERERRLRGTAIVRRPMGRKLQLLAEPPSAFVVMLEGEGLRGGDNVAQPLLIVQGMRFSPGGLVIPRPTRLQIENKQSMAVTILAGARPTRPIAPGEIGEIELAAGQHLLTIKELPFASADVRVLERGRALPLNDDEIPLTDIPGGTYDLTFFFGAEPLRIQPIIVPDTSLVFIDATVSALKVVEVSVKDASMRVAVPPTLRFPTP